MMMISALTPTSTPPIAMILISESSLEPRLLRRYRHAICNSSLLTPASSLETVSHRGYGLYPTGTSAVGPLPSLPHPSVAFRIPSLANSPRPHRPPLRPLPHATFPAPRADGAGPADRSAR